MSNDILTTFGMIRNSLASTDPAKGGILGDDFRKLNCFFLISLELVEGYWRIELVHVVNTKDTK